MEASNRSALKEWAAVERVLAAGESLLLLRKGGIRERRRDFEVEHREFWIFPTRFHQSPGELAPAAAGALEAARALDPGPDRVRIEHYAVVHDAWRVEDLAALERLEGAHALAPTTVESRFHYRGQPYLHVLLLRLFRMPEPYLIPDTLDYQGCVSWVALDDALSTAGAVPVLDDTAFARAREEVVARLGGGEGIARLLP